MELLLSSSWTLHESIQGFILNESGGGKSSSGYLGPIHRQRPNMSRLLCVSLFWFKMEYNLLSMWIPRSVLTGLKFFLGFQSNHIKHNIHSNLSAKSRFHCLLQFTQDCILITENYSASIIAATGRGGTKNYPINHSYLSRAYICRLCRRSKSNHLAF